MSIANVITTYEHPDVTAAPFLVLFYSWQLRKNTENAAAVTSLRTFIHSKVLSLLKDCFDLISGFEKEKKKEKKIDLSERGIEPQIFSNFPTHDLNFHGRWGWWDQI